MTTQMLKELDKIEILTLQDNYIEMTAMDNNAVITRAIPLKDGEIRASILAEHGYSAMVKTTMEDKKHALFSISDSPKMARLKMSRPWVLI